VGQAMVNAAPVTEQPPRPTIIRNGFTPDDMAGMAFSVCLGTALITVMVMRRFARRRWGQGIEQTPAPAIQRNAQNDRIEQAIDTIAVEIERVSENQRFMTRLMTETQLAGSIAAVRGSTELAKAAAEKAGG